MYVCVCNAVTERHIVEAARNGTTRLRQLRETLGVTAECGRCAKCAHQCLREALSSPGIERETLFRTQSDTWFSLATEAP
ncbi:MAG: (2Fe-2S)-binding protein [Proteobacteria bacterium]|nr:(2Fe-2S)-binding protein [Pseudomonadota bacterium]